jgi:hypothetical protein
MLGGHQKGKFLYVVAVDGPDKGLGNRLGRLVHADILTTPRRESRRDESKFSALGRKSCAWHGMPEPHPDWPALRLPNANPNPYNKREL